jgi:hypothetical protein
MLASLATYRASLRRERRSSVEINTQHSYTICSCLCDRFLGHIFYCELLGPRSRRVNRLHGSQMRQRRSGSQMRQVTCREPNVTSDVPGAKCDKQRSGSQMRQVTCRGPNATSDVPGAKCDSDIPRPTLVLDRLRQRTVFTGTR